MKKEKVTKIGKEEASLITFIALIIATLITLIGGIQIVILFIQSGVAKDQEPIASHEQNVKDLAKRELVTSKISGIQTHVLTLNENLVVIEHDKLKINNINNKKQIVPFFYTQKEGDLFKKEFLPRGGKVKTEKTNLGFVYNEFVKNNDTFDYMLFKKENTWQVARFENIPIYYPQNKETRSPFFIEQNGRIVSIPYFLDKRLVSEALANLGEKWEVKEVNLLVTLNHIATHELGSVVNIVGLK